MVSQADNVLRLYLVRHAHASWAPPGSRDFDRPLDAKGLAEARNVALQAYTAGLVPGRIVSSPARRCAETTAAFLEIFGDLPASFDDRFYSDGLDAYLDSIRTHTDARSLMLVGHNPMIETLSEFLSGQSDVSAALNFGFPTAGLLTLDLARPLMDNMMHQGTPVLVLSPALN
jgi:phosphohistidine phosphatase